MPAIRVNPLNEAPPRRGRFVLYWMIAARRTHHNYALQHAIAQARRLGLPLVVLEALRVGYRWASPRLHRFVIDGMADQRARFGPTPIAYHPYIEDAAGRGAGLLEALAGEAALVVTDDYPCFFLPHMVRAACDKLAALGVRLEQVDGNGILPLRAADRTFTAAMHFRRFLQTSLPPHLGDDAFPEADPLAAVHDLPRAIVPDVVRRRWPAPTDQILAGGAETAHLLAALPLDHTVGVVAYRGGERAAQAALEHFVTSKLARYHEVRSHPDDDVASGLSPYLHFGQISAHAIVERVLARDGWTCERLAPRPNGRREGWWNLSPEAEGFLDELITWRELGVNACFIEPERYESFEAVPAWARATLARHTADPRAWVYPIDVLAEARTHDPLWNAAQRQLLAEGRIHNYLRMLWGKKVLEWSATPEEAFEILVELNNRYAIDGRDPNSYSGIAWTFGRYDRPWGPERPIFGTVRFMSSQNTAKKLRVNEYLRRFSG